MKSRLGRLFVHPWHPPTVHYPIALLTTSLLWDVIALWGDSSPWPILAYWNQAAGLALSGLTLTLGMADAVRYVWSEEFPPSRTVGRLTLVHLGAMLLGVALFASSFFLRSRPGGAPLGVVILSAFGTIALVIGGWVGGALVYGEGVGREKPRVSGQ